MSNYKLELEISVDNKVEYYVFLFMEQYMLTDPREIDLNKRMKSIKEIRKWKYAEEDHRYFWSNSEQYDSLIIDFVLNIKHELSAKKNIDYSIDYFGDKELISKL